MTPGTRVRTRWTVSFWHPRPEIPKGTIGTVRRTTKHGRAVVKFDTEAKVAVVNVADLEEMKA